MRAKYNDCAPPVIISGHQFTMASHHQDAAREYLEAYKLLPESPLISLCVGKVLVDFFFSFNKFFRPQLHMLPTLLNILESDR